MKIVNYKYFGLLIICIISILSSMNSVASLEAKKLETTLSYISKI
jgi:hypothetical protein